MRGSGGRVRAGVAAAGRLILNWDAARAATPSPRRVTLTEELCTITRGPRHVPRGCEQRTTFCIGKANASFYTVEALGYADQLREKNEDRHVHAVHPLNNTDVGCAGLCALIRLYMK